MGWAGLFFVVSGHKLWVSVSVGTTGPVLWNLGKCGGTGRQAKDRLPGVCYCAGCGKKEVAVMNATVRTGLVAVRTAPGGIEVGFWTCENGKRGY